MRPAQLRDQARGNLTALMVVPLPVGLPDPGRRLQQIAAQTASRKAEHRPSVGTVLHGPMPRWAVLAVMSHQRVNLASADVPGPQQPLYLAGARLLEVFPVLPLMAKTTLGVGALSYAGQFNIMAVADQDTCPTSMPSPPPPGTNSGHSPHPRGSRPITTSSAEHRRGRRRPPCATCRRHPAAAIQPAAPPEDFRADATRLPVLPPRPPPPARPSRTAVAGSGHGLGPSRLRGDSPLHVPPEQRRNHGNQPGSVDRRPQALP
jgi:WS/DGAT C-terminal domain